MGRLTTHVLDTMHGTPAAGLHVVLSRLDGPLPGLVREAVLNADGRTDTPLLDGPDFVPGRYRLEFGVSAYFRGRGVTLPEPAFLDVVPIDFGLADPAQHYHVPLLTSPWAYATYRGS
jgi:5-hydroxyisourate hydrolase